jgi:CBS domain-containing protein
MGAVLDVTVSDLILITDKARKHAQMRHAEALLVKNLMTRPVHTISPDTTLSEAAHLMLSMQISGLPVVDPLKRLIGIITEADLLNAVGVPCHHPTHNIWQTLEAMFSGPIQLREPSETVGALMITEVITMHPQHSVHDALDAMKAHRVKRLVVVDGERHPVGIISRSNLVRVFFERFKEANASPTAD